MKHLFSTLSKSQPLKNALRISYKRTTSVRRATQPTTCTLSTKPLIKRPERTKYRTLLAIDGGGLRGMIPVMVLKQLEWTTKEYIFDHKDTLIPEPVRDKIKSVDDFNIDLTDYFDLVAGTSVGSWIACYVASRGKGSETFCHDPKIVAKYGPLRPGSVEVGRVLLLEYAARVFPQSIFRSIRRIFFPKYPTDGLEATLKELFQETTMDDMEMSCLIPSYDLERSAPCSFVRDPILDEKNYTVRTKARLSTRTQLSPEESAVASTQFVSAFTFKFFHPDLDIIPGTNYFLRDIVLASSSAPTFFRPARIAQINTVNPEEMVLADGGLVANSPSVQALTFAPVTFSSGNIKHVAIFSVGCGVVDPRSRQDYNPGLLWWLSSGSLIDAFTKGMGEYIQAVLDFWFYQYLNLPLGQYVRIQISAKADTDLGKILANMDNPANVPELEKIGRRLGKENIAVMKAFLRDYVFKVGS